LRPELTPPLQTVTGSEHKRIEATPVTDHTEAMNFRTARANSHVAARNRSRRPKTRIAVNLLTEDPNTPSGAHWCWTRVVRDMAARLSPDEEMHLIVSPASRSSYEGFGDNVHYITYPWSNERRSLRTLTEHLYSPLRLPLSRINLLSTPIAPVFNPSWSVVVHMKTMHAFTEPGSLSPAARAYRRFSYPRSTRVADAVVINSESLRSEIERYLDVDPRKLKLVYEAVDHELFRPGDPRAARERVAAYGVNKPFVLFVSSLWPYKNCAGLLRAWALVRDQLGDRQLAIVGGGKDEKHMAELRSLVAELGIGADVVFVGGVPQEQTVHFYRAADVLVYASFNETFGLPILEAMATACPVVTSDVSSMPEIAGGAAVLCDPSDISSIARSMLTVLEGGATQLRGKGIKRAGEFTWAAAAAQTLDVYREVAERRGHKA
jgi:glycosyltransferase involved in cell wall biosynthesis